MATQSTMLELGTIATDFRLASFDGKVTALRPTSTTRAGWWSRSFAITAPSGQAHPATSSRASRASISHGRIAVVAINANDNRLIPPTVRKAWRRQARSAGDTFLICSMKTPRSRQGVPGGVHP